MKRFLVLLAIALVLCSCASTKPRLVIIHANDTHSHYEPIRSGEDAGLGGLIERAAFVDSVRNAVGEDKVLLLHAGDFSQGSIYFSELRGEFEPLIINDLRYDCVTLGNHEFDNGLENLVERLSGLKNTEIVSSNIDIAHLELAKYVKPYTVIERGGMKIGIIGLAPNLRANVSASVSSRFEQLDNVEVCLKWADFLRNEKKVDMIILLSHLGMDEDMELIPNTENIDLVIGGHSHTQLEEMVYVADKNSQQVPIVTDWCWGMEMGLVKIW